MTVDTPNKNKGVKINLAVAILIIIFSVLLFLEVTCDTRLILMRMYLNFCALRHPSFVLSVKKIGLIRLTSRLTTPYQDCFNWPEAVLSPST